MAVEGHGLDARHDRRRWRSGERSRSAIRCDGDSRSGRGYRPMDPLTQGARSDGTTGHGQPRHRRRDDPRRDHRGSLGRSSRRCGPRRRGRQRIDHRRPGHREHHRGRSADRRSHRMFSDRGDRSGYLYVRRHCRTQATCRTDSTRTAPRGQATPLACHSSGSTCRSRTPNRSTQRFVPEGAQ